MKGARHRSAARGLIPALTPRSRLKPADDTRVGESSGRGTRVAQPLPSLSSLAGVPQFAGDRDGEAGGTPSARRSLQQQRFSFSMRRKATP